MGDKPPSSYYTHIRTAALGRHYLSLLLITQEKDITTAKLHWRKDYKEQKAFKETNFKKITENILFYPILSHMNPFS